MGFFQAIFKVIEEKNCPLYTVGDEFKLSGNALFLPIDKPICLILSGDITKILIQCKQNSQKGCFEDDNNLMSCRGCTGIARFAIEKDKLRTSSEKTTMTDDDIQLICDRLKDFSIFKSLKEQDIKELVLILKRRKLTTGEIILNKGETGDNFFIILSGKVDVLGDDDISIAKLGQGEVFGEMSLLSGDLVGATIKVSESGSVLYINGKDFRNVLNKYPSLQMYFAKLLARRLARTNIVRSEDYASGMIGKLSEISPSELFQTFNVNQKSGALIFYLQKGSAEVYFKDGSLIRAIYGEKKNQEAFFQILKETDGRFKFISGLSDNDMQAQPIGDFMWLLMEGLRKIDEETEGKE